jgi:pantetheine-phosphate adenylyltransferase
MNTKAVYPGSFDPFTNGHMDIVRKAAALFEQVTLVIGVNAKKRREFDPEGMRQAMITALADAGITNCTVCVHDGLLAEFAHENGIHYMIRGLRNNMDYNYEENMAEVNKLINPELEYVYFRADNVAVSSSMVKELRQYNQDISPYVPAAILRYMDSERSL